MVLKDDKAIELWMDYLTGELSGEQEEELFQYLSSHPELKKELKADEIIWAQINDIPRPSPSSNMDVKFEAMLQGYKSANKRNAAINWRPVLQDWLTRSWRVGLTSLAIGLTLGWYLLPSKNQKSEIATLSTEVADMKKLMMLTLIEQPDAQERIRAVSLAVDLPNADQKVIDALSNTLKTDQNINVRLAALESLMNYWNYPAAREEMVKSIVVQESPLVQSAIADAMMALREKSSITEFYKLLEQPELNAGVKTKIESTIEKLQQI
jgi:hypothetical protein